MGSSCSSRQSDKDSISERSESSTNEKGDDYYAPKKGEETPSKETEAKIIESKKIPHKLENDFSSCGDEGIAVGTPTSSTITSGIIRDKSANKIPQKPQMELPDLSNFKPNHRELIMGNPNQVSSHSNKLIICLVGSFNSCSNPLKKLEDYLNETLVAKHNKEGLEIVVVSPQSSIPVLKSSHTNTHIINHYIKESARSCNEVLVVFYSDSWNVLPGILSEKYFQALLTNHGDQSELIQKYYKQDSVSDWSAYKLVPAHLVHQNLYSSDTSLQEKDYESWCSDYKALVDCTSTLEAYKNNLINKELENFSSLSNCRAQLFIKNSASQENKIENLIKTKFNDCLVTSLEDSASTDSIFETMRTTIEQLATKSIQNNNSNQNSMEGKSERLIHEISLHSEFSNQLLTTAENIGRLPQLQEVKEYLTNDCTKPLILTGAPGSGKSTLIAQVASMCQSWTNNLCSITRFIGVSERSSTLEGILYYLWEHSCILFGADSNQYKWKNAGTSILKSWRKCSSERSLVVFLDGLDSLFEHDTPTIELLQWINELPQHVKVVLSLQKGSKTVDQLSKVISGPSLILNFDSATDLSEKIFKSTLNQNLSNDFESPPSFQDISSLNKSSVTPLLILTLTEIVLICCEFSIVVKSALDEPIQLLFISLPTVFPQEFVESILGCISLTKIGLTESEIISITKLKSLQTSNSCFDWLLLRKTIWPLLRTHKENGVVLIGWRNLYIRNLAINYFLKTEAQKSKCEKIFRKIVTKSEDKNIFNKISQSTDNSINRIRTFQESSTLSNMEGANFQHLYSLDWMEQKIKTCSPFAILNDLKLAEEKLKSEEIRLLHSVFQSSMQNLICEASQLHSQLYGRLKFSIKGKNFQNIIKLIENISSTKVSKLLPLSPYLRNSLEENSSENETNIAENIEHINSIFRIPDHPGLAITLSITHSQVTVWDIRKKEIVRTLNGINQPRNLEMIDSSKCLLLCGRELKIYDLNTGTFLMKLREVMNQKMPFFGLHNKDHVVALSRNRMNVNMMNLNEGTCVTTFKVGEDRFISSLVVSQNGAICVCGDDSQKPSALLVWDLESRKLLYDLRIPHHEFDTSLVAITNEGHFVSSVSKENDDPAPNFIVVYDLCSGTLFKRWKPDVNTTSITISTAGTCVIVGLEDASIMAYDLITGNARWTVKGHSESPDIFKIDPQGVLFISYNSTGKDRSLRVWDIQTGSALAVLNPDDRITACEIVQDGQAVVLALENHKEIISFVVSLEESGYASELKESMPNVYGDENLNGKIFDLTES